MPGIDDPLDAVRKQYLEEPPNEVADLALTVLGNLTWAVGLVGAIRTHFSRKAASENLLVLFNAIQTEVSRLDKDIKNLQERIDSAEFTGALLVAADQTVRTSHLRRIQQFGAILGHELAEGEGHQTWDEAAAYVRDLAELRESDIEALGILVRIQSKSRLFSAGQRSTPTDPNVYTETLQQVLKEVDRHGITRDEFYSRCSRLSGFGLTLEVQRNNSRQSPGDHCFRFTGRGKRLIELLKGIMSQ